jgi:hypothetical protein
VAAVVARAVPEAAAPPAAATAVAVPLAASRSGRAWLWGTVILTAGAIVAAVVLAPAASAQPTQGLAWLLFTGSSAHVAATGWFYTVPQVRTYMRQHLARYLWIPLALMAGAGVLAGVLDPAAIQWGLLLYFAWQFFHYQKQNLGMAALAGSAHRLEPLARGERRALLAGGIAGVAGLLSHPGLLQLTVRPGLGFVFPATMIAFVVAVISGALLLARRPASQRPPGFCAVYLTSLGFSLPVFVFSSPYAAVAGLTIAHGLQYLLLVGLVAGGDGHGRQRVIRLAALSNIALIGGAILSATSHLHNAQPGARIFYGAYLGAVMAHFVVDAGLWRLRDRFPREFLASRVPYLLPAKQPAG